MHFHPCENELIEYSSGSADWAVSICISTHIHYCAACKVRLTELNALGGHCLSAVPEVAIGDSSFMHTMAKIRSREGGQANKSVQTESSTVPASDGEFNALPKVLRKVIKSPDVLKWSSLSPSLKAARLKTDQDKYEVCLHKIKRGAAVAEHDHRGREITVVLEGSFSDENGTYSPGDYIVKLPGETHRPTAARNKDCLCLSIVEAPVKLTGLLGVVVNPFLKIQPQ